VKVLILHQYFNTPESGGPLRSYYLAKALVDAGHTVAVITTHNGTDARKEIVEGVDVHYLPIPYNNRFGFFKRITSFLKFVFSIVQSAGQFKDYDVCYAISTPLTIGLAAIWIKWRYKIQYIFEVGDLWPEAPIQIGIIKNPILKIILYRLEKLIYKRSKSIVALSEPIRESIETKVKKPVYVIPNMADTNFYKPSGKESALEQKFGVEGKFVLSYLGTFGLANGLERMLHCAREAQQQNLPVHFLLCGDGAQYDSLHQHVGQLALKNVSIIPMQNRQGVQEVLNVTDAAFISYLPLPVLETGSPNKYFDALAAGKLIVVNFEGWIKNEIEAAQCGVFTRREDFSKAIMPFLEDRNVLQKAQHAARVLAEQKYSRVRLSIKFSKLFN
jgi:glycosyltransferase involved in cell wall biosynthesis